MRLRSAFKTLDAPTADELAGRWEPVWLGSPLRVRASRSILNLTALRGWTGKEITPAGDATNLAMRRGEERRVLPMRLSIEDSLVDGRPVAVLTYPPDTPRPFRWMRDELRWLEPGQRLAGMSFLVVGDRRIGPQPFLLRRA